MIGVLWLFLAGDRSPDSVLLISVANMRAAIDPKAGSYPTVLLRTEQISKDPKISQGWWEVEAVPSKTSDWPESHVHNTKYVPWRVYMQAHGPRPIRTSCVDMHAHLIQLEGSHPQDQSAGSCSRFPTGLHSIT